MPFGQVDGRLRQIQGHELVQKLVDFSRSKAQIILQKL